MIPDVEFTILYRTEKPLSVTESSVLNRSKRNFPVEYVNVLEFPPRSPQRVCAKGLDIQGPTKRNTAFSVFLSIENCSNYLMPKYDKGIS